MSLPISKDRIPPAAELLPSKTTFFELLRERSKISLLCVALDPHSHTPKEAVEESKRLIRLTKDYAAAYKPTSAFFELFGSEGWNALREVIAAIPPNIPCILDSKRGDMASAAEAYAKSAFEYLHTHSITVSPYMGGEASVEQWTQHKRKGVWVICKTSNAGTKDLQCLPIKNENGKMLYEVVAEEAVMKWGRKNQNVGLVVSGAEPRAVASVRARAPLVWLLVPDIPLEDEFASSNLLPRWGRVHPVHNGERSSSSSTKTNTTSSTCVTTTPTITTPAAATHPAPALPEKSLETIVRSGLRSLDKSGILISVSSEIANADDPRQAAKLLMDRINAIRFGPRQPAQQAQRSLETLMPLAAGLISTQAVKLGTYNLPSGNTSPILIDLRRVMSFPAVMKLVAKEYAKVLKQLTFDRIAGVPYSGLPFATAAALESNMPLIYTRKEGETSGTQCTIEGEYKKGDKIVILDDCVAVGNTKLETYKKFQALGLEVVGIVVLIDYELGARQFFGKLGIPFEAVASLNELVTLWERNRSISSLEAELVRNFVKAEKRFPSHL